MSRTKLWLAALAALVILGASYWLTRTTGGSESPGSSVADSAPLPASRSALEGLLVDGRLARPDEYHRIVLIRRGDSVPVVPGIALEEGDRLTTVAGITALVTLAYGYEMILEPRPK